MSDVNTGQQTTAVKRSDLVDQNIEKVFQKGFAADRPIEMAAQLPAEPEEVAPANIAVIPPARPAFGVSAVEADAAKMMSMAGPLIPVWLRANPGHCWGIIQLSKRWTRFDRRTNSWIHFDPITIAQASYMVRAQDGTESVGYMSVFIRALIDAFAPLQTALRYSWAGEGETRTCTVTGLLRGETLPHSYTTPELRRITPKKSPLWSSDSDRQLAYYGSRAWGRLYAAGVLHGVYDEDELEGERTAVAGPALVASSGLAERLRQAQAAQDPLATSREGYREGVVEQGLESGKPARASGKPKGAKKARGATRTAQDKKTRPTASPDAPEGRSEIDPPPIGERVDFRDQPVGTQNEQPAPPADAELERQAADQPPVETKKPAPPKQPAPPKNLTQYRDHVRRWLMELTTEQGIEERFASERNLRNQCGVTADDRAKLRAEYIDPRIQELRRADNE